VESVADVAELLSSELVTNAVVHAHTAVELLAARDDTGGLRVDVYDRAPADHLEPQPRRADPVAEGGRGLAIVASLATSWGVDEAGNGKSVWFTLSTVP
jgi:anti-sigma regulatory factor (Ser/Thr protein kinase)